MIPELPVWFVIPIAIISIIVFYWAVFAERIEGAEEHRRWVEEQKRKS